MVTTLRQNFAVRVPGGLTPLHFGYDGTMQPRAFDLVKARALLGEAGYTEAFEIPLNFSPGAVPGAERLTAARLARALGPISALLSRLTALLRRLRLKTTLSG